MGKQLRSQTRLVIELLEDRRVLAVENSFSNGVLRINGDGARDFISIHVDGSGYFLVATPEATEYVADSEGALAGYETCNSIEIYGGGGEDQYTHQLDNSISFLFDGGEGVQDRLDVGGDGNFGVTAGAISGANATHSNVEFIGVHGGDGPNTIVNSGFSGYVAFTGGGGDDILHGGSNQDQLYGDEGNDTLRGHGHDDRLFGGGGDDNIRGGDGDDSIYGGSGIDRINGDDGSDNLYGEEDNDLLTDTLGEFAQLFGGPGNDRLTGGEGSDYLHGEEGNDVVLGGGGFNNIYGDSGNDTLTGGSSADRFYPGLGSDKVNGGEGIDYLFETRNSNFTLTDTSLKVAAETDTISKLEYVELTGGDSRNVFTITSADLDVTVLGKAGADRIIFNAISNEMSIVGGVGTADLGLYSFNPKFAAVQTYLDPIEELVVNLTPGDDNVDIRDFTGKLLKIDGKEGENHIFYTKDANITLTDTFVRDSLGNLIGFNNFKEATISTEAAPSGAPAVADRSPIVASASTGTKTLQAREYTGSITAQGSYKVLNLASDAAWERVDLSAGRITRADEIFTRFDVAKIISLNMQSKGSSADVRIVGDPIAVNQQNEGFSMTIAGTGSATDKIGWTVTGSAATRIDFNVAGAGTGNILGGLRTLVGVLAKYSSFERLNYTGNDANGEVRFTGSSQDNPVPITASAKGGGGDKSRVVFGGVMPANVSVTDSRITGSNATAIGLGGFEEMVLNIVAGSDALLNVSGWHNKGVIYSNTSSGTNKVVISGDSNYTLTDTRLLRASGGDFQLTRISNIEIVGGPSANTIDASRFTKGGVVLRGGGGNDTLRGGSYNDELFGNDNDDFLYGNGGNDTLNGGTGTDRGDGGPDDDTGIGLETRISIEQVQAAMSALDEWQTTRKTRKTL